MPLCSLLNIKLFVGFLFMSLQLKMVMPHMDSEMVYLMRNTFRDKMVILTSKTTSRQDLEHDSVQCKQRGRSINLVELTE